MNWVALRFGSGLGLVWVGLRFGLGLKSIVMILFEIYFLRLGGYRLNPPELKCKSIWIGLCFTRKNRSGDDKCKTS